MALFIEEDRFRLSFEVYEKMRNFIFDKCRSMFSKLDRIVEFNDEKPLDPEETVKLMYFNDSNLAFKQTQKFTKKLLNKELRHYLNIIMNKFKDNSSLVEYQITTTNYWVVGRRSIPRTVIVILPISLSQSDAETQAAQIVNEYFAYL